MSSTVRLSAKMPADSDTNGLDSMHAELVTDPAAIRYAVVLFDVAKVTLDTDTDKSIPTVRVRRFEPLGLASDAAPTLQKLVAEAHQERTGAEALPFDAVAALEHEER